MARGLDEVLRNLERWASRERAASLALARRWAAEMEGYMRANAPWTDRTGAARAGLFGVAFIDGDDIVIAVAHTVKYGVFLELAHDGRYAILWPTVRNFQDRVKRSFEELWRR